MPEPQRPALLDVLSRGGLEEDDVERFHAHRQGGATIHQAAALVGADMLERTRTFNGRRWVAAPEANRITGAVRRMLATVSARP